MNRVGRRDHRTYGSGSPSSRRSSPTSNRSPAGRRASPFSISARMRSSSRRGLPRRPAASRGVSPPSAGRGRRANHGSGGPKFTSAAASLGSEAGSLLGRSHRGYLVIKLQTARSRLRRALKHVALWCRANRHQLVIEQQRSLNLKLRGHHGYYGITGDFRALKGFRDEVACLWRPCPRAEGRAESAARIVATLV